MQKCVTVPSVDDVASATLGSGCACQGLDNPKTLPLLLNCFLSIDMPSNTEAPDKRSSQLIGP